MPQSQDARVARRDVRMTGWVGAPAGAGDRKFPLRAVASAQHLKWVTKSRVPSEQDGTELHPSWQAAAVVQTRQPAAYPGRAHAGGQARLGYAGDTEAQFHIDSLFSLLKKASALNYLHLAGKFILVGRDCVYDANLKALGKESSPGKLIIILKITCAFNVKMLQKVIQAP